MDCYTIFFSPDKQAVRDGRRDLVPLLLNRLPKGSRKLNERDKDGFAAIHYAARFNRTFMINQLLSALPGVCVFACTWACVGLYMVLCVT